jgi:hypothetical protein
MRAKEILFANHDLMAGQQAEIINEFWRLSQILDIRSKTGR